MKSCLLCGVGGQGTVLASRILAQAAMEQGLFARTAETIGMAQRGGCVVSHVRVGEKVASPLIPEGKADVILGFEPGETVRNLKYLKKGGCVVVCSKGINPVMSSVGGKSYDDKKMVDYLKKTVARCYVIDGDRIAEECGSTKVLNVALVGAAIETGELGIALESVEKVLSVKVKAAFLTMNQKALTIGAMQLKEKS